MRLKLSFLLLSLLSLSFFAEAAGYYNYQYLMKRDGLGSDWVLSTFMDSKGYVWICTMSGLDRYDGSEIIHFSDISGVDSAKENSGFVSRVAEDRHGRLWIASDNGLKCFDLESGSVCPAVSPDLKNAQYIQESPIDNALTDEEGNLWLTSNDRLLYCSLDEDGRISKIDCKTVEDNSICAITVHDGKIWLACEEHFYRFVSNSGNIAEIPTNNYPGLDQIPNAHSLYSMGDNLWIGSTTTGVYCFNVKSKELLHYSHELSNKNSLSDNGVRCISSDKSGNILVGTNFGLNVIRHGLVERIVKEANEATLSDVIVSDINPDKNGNIWISTLFGGVNVLTPKRIDFECSLNNDGNIIRSVYEDHDGNLLLSSYNEGLGFRRKGGKDFVFPDREGRHINKIISSIAQDGKGNYWLATSEGVQSIEKQGFPTNLRVKTYDSSNSGLGGNYIRELRYDAKRDRMWICTSVGVDYMDLESNEIHSLEFADEEELELYNTIYLDSHDRLWVGGNGVIVYFPANLGKDGRSHDTFCLKSKLDDPESKISERVSSILETQNGEIYIGTQNNGLFMFVESAKHELSFTNMLLDKRTLQTSITSITEDEESNLWLGSDGKLFKYSLANKSVIKFDESDGLPDRRFYINSGCCEDGKLVLGTTGGLVEISGSASSRSFNSERTARVVCARNGDRLILRDGLESLDIYPANPSFSISFSALDYTEMKSISYEVKIEGIDNDWILCNSSSVSFSNMRHGKYRMRIRCTNPDNTWSKNESVIFINIHPRFWQTRLFVILLLLGIVLAAFVAIAYALHKEKLTQRRLNDRVQEKTRDLTEALGTLKKQNVEIRQQKASLEEYALRMSQSDKEKMQLMANLTHEFKTPLTLILGPLSQIQSTLKDKSVAPGLQIIERNAKYLLSLVNQLMDLRKVDAGKVQLKFAAFNIKEVGDKFYLDYQPMLEERHIRYNSIQRLRSENIVSDKKVIVSIISNLISNAIKYSPDKGSITLYSCQWATEDARVLMQYISVHNSGSYISEEEIGKIFNSFYKIDNQVTYASYGQSSTGIGLYLVKELTTELGGRISVKSSKKTGTSFRLYFPVEAAPDSVQAIDKEDSYMKSTEAEGVNEMEIPFEPSQTKKPVLLLVEDNQDMRNYIKSLLSPTYDVAEATNGEKGYAMAMNIIPDFIVSDLMMPVCDGIKFCAKIRGNDNLCHIPFLMLTALSADDARLKTYKTGADSFLTKPFDPDMLTTRIENILENRRRQQSQLVVNLDEAYAKVDIEKPDKVFMEKVSQIMKQNYSDSNFNVSELVSAVGMSSTSFYKKITALTGLTTTHYMRLYRLQTAMHIIEDHKNDKGLNVSEIAYMVGFNDPKYFTRCFVAQYGTRPSSLLSAGGQEQES